MTNPTTDRQSITGRLAKRPWAEGDDLPAVGNSCLVSGANQDMESDQHRNFLQCRVVGYTVDNKFVCFQVPGCWPTVERLTNCWFADEKLLLDAAAPDLLKALKAVREFMDDPQRECPLPVEIASAVREAIAKAEL